MERRRLAEPGLLIELVVQHLWVSCLSYLCFSEKGIDQSLSWCSFWFLLLTGAESEAWLSLLGFVTTVASPTLLNWIFGVSMKGLWVNRAATADLWTELLISRQHRQELLQRTFLNRFLFLYPFFPHYLGRLKHLKNYSYSSVKYKWIEML